MFRSSLGPGSRSSVPDPVSGAVETDELKHSDGFKARMVQRMSGPERISATALSREVGVAQPTLSRWLREAPKVASMAKRKKSPKGKTTKRPSGPSAEEKLRLVLEASRLGDEDFGAFLRREGVHEAQLREWTEAAMAAMSSQTKRAKSSPEAKRIRELEKDLRLKEKALAEVTALLALKKKIAEIWGDGDDDTPTRSGT